MYLFALTSQLLREMGARKLRSVLAIFCISFGTIAVVLLLALGTGFHNASMKNMMDIVDGSFFIWSDKTSVSYHGFPKGQPITFDIGFINNLPQLLPTIKYISPWLITRSFGSFHGKQSQFDVYGVTPHLQGMRKIKLEPGSRFLNILDIKNNVHTTILGYKVKAELLQNQLALGKTIFIRNVPFTVVGIIPKTSEGGPTDDYADAALISLAAYGELFGTKTLSTFMLFPKPGVAVDQFEQNLRNLMANKYHFASSDRTAVHIFNTNKMFKFMYWFFIAIQIFLGLCGTMTLGVGSVGVANIMFLIVTERTREIGLRKALGATTWHILWQILLEALVIVTIGGGVGISVSYLITFLLQHLTLPDWLGIPSISFPSLIVTLFILTLVGLIAGFFPAKRAAKLDPIVALTL